ncbi:MAG: 16S rRNA (uracil(1498)-N(3))-methyltransferase [Prevotella sp.]|nr:16S rRNA (uracil(1498)-N(3))-methyltransferase [Prevotella sp.]
MKEQRYFYVPDAANTNELPEEEAKHAVRVLRLQPGDEIFLIDGVGSFHAAVVELVTNKKAFYGITRTIPQQRTWRGHIHLAIAPTKMIDRMEWMVEKAVEIGVDEISFLDTAFTERKVIRTDRLEKIAIAAMKQSRKAWLSKINPMMPFNKFIECEREGACCIAHCYDEMPRIDYFSFIQNEKMCNDFSSQSGSLLHGGDSSITILVGPEGDFSIEEVDKANQNGFTGVSLGSSRLRTETAGLAAVMMAHLARRL